MQYTENAVKISSSYTISSWPFSTITLSYNFGDRKSSYVPQKKKYYDGTVNGVAASYDISYTNFNISLGSSVEFLQNDFISQEKSQSLYHYISASYSPHSTIYITPSIGYSTDIYKGAYANYQYDSLDLSVSLSYIPQKLPFSLSYYISHSRYKGNDSFSDNSGIYSALSLEWVVRKLNNKKQSVIRLDVEQSNYTDNIYTDSSLNDIFVGLSWAYEFR